MALPSRPPLRLVALLLFATLFIFYNADGREIGGGDSQSSKLAARQIVLHHTLILDDEISRVPALATRATFARDRTGHFRSAYSPDGAIAGSVTAWVLKTVGRVDLNAPRAPNLVAVITASTTTALAVVLVFLTLARLSTPTIGLMVAIGLGLGTNLWALDSRTLAEHDLVALGLAVCLFNWTRATDELGTRHLVAGALGLAIAETARFQTLPAVSILMLGLVARVGVRRALLPSAIVAGAIASFFAVEWSWFGNILGALPELERLHPQVHDVVGSYSRTPWVGALGLLISPDRGLFVFSPIVLIAIAGIPAALRVFTDRGLGWAFIAALVEFTCYSLYSVWWGGHTYGPRYVLDLIVLLSPAAAAALMITLRTRWARAVCTMLLIFSIGVAGVGAFYSDPWNTSPRDVDRSHDRLWNWRDLQIRRDLAAGLSPQDFDLFNATSVRVARK